MPSTRYTQLSGTIAEVHTNPQSCTERAASGVLRGEPERTPLLFQLTVSDFGAFFFLLSQNRWVNTYFRSTRFVDREDDMFVPLTSTKDPRYAKRRQYVVDRVVDGVDAEVCFSLTRTRGGL